MTTTTKTKKQHIIISPSWKIDELARHVLHAAHWPPLPTDTSTTNNKNNNSNINDEIIQNSSPTPHLDELERALEIHVLPLKNQDTIINGGNNVRTCTVPNGMVPQTKNSNGATTAATNNNNNNNTSTCTSKDNGIWTWTPQLNNANNSYTKSSSRSEDGTTTPTTTAATTTTAAATLANSNATTATNSNDMTLEEMAPFSPEFYRAMGELTREAFYPGSVKMPPHHQSDQDEMHNASTTTSSATLTTATTAITTTTANKASTTSCNSIYKAIYSLEQYSLPRMQDAVRITRILLSLQELHVDDDDDGEGMGECVSGSNGGSKKATSFLQKLLHYCEGMEIRKNGSVSKDGMNPMACGSSSTKNDNHNTNNNNNKNNNTSSNEKDHTTTHQVRGKRIPLLSAIFHHWSNLPQLEHALQQLSRRYTSLLPMNSNDYWNYCEFSSMGIRSSNATDDGTGGCNAGSGGTISSIKVQTTSFLGARALKIDSFKSRLEDELQCHVNGGSSSTITTTTSSSSNGSRHSGSDRKRRANNLPEQGGLIALLSLIYQSSDATLRGKCRRWMGQWLRSFALGGGVSSMSYTATRGIVNGGVDGDGSGGDDSLGPSFASFCPLVMATSFGMANTSGGGGGGSGSSGGGGMAATGPISITHIGGGGGLPNHSLGMENTSACGIDALLKVLLRIIMGFKPLPLCDSSTVVIMTDVSGDTSNPPQRSTALRPSHENLLFGVLIPLHRPSGMVLWRDQMPLIGLYHESLVKCIGSFLTMDRTLVGPIIGALLHPDIWPTEGGLRGSSSAAGGGGSGTAAANTPKVILLLHEVDTLIGLLLPGKGNEEQDVHHLSSFDPHLLPLTLRLCTCISSENSRTSERALQFFKNKTFQRLVQRRLNDVGPQFLRALCRCSGGGGTAMDCSPSFSDGFEVPWNPTVRKMTFLVLVEIEGFYKEASPDNNADDAFDCACEEAFSGGSLLKEDGTKSNDHTKIQNATVKKKDHVASGSAKMCTRPCDVATTPGADMTTLRGAMGSWRPPPQKSRSAMPPTSRSKLQAPGGRVPSQPPLIGKGAAPWAMGSQNPRVGPSPATRDKSSAKQPPLTITGVAPWAFNKPPHAPPSSRYTQGFSAALPRPQGSPLPPSINGDVVEVCITEEEENDAHDESFDENDLGIASPALRKVRSFMERLKPPVGNGENNTDGVSSWALAQMEESPVLLPNMKFHDLVFGQELGTGAFSTVKYARQIVKHRTRSSWPEYAVKIVSTQKIEELGYEQSINREIAILKMMSHPGISRLISSFRFRDGAYLVLEYASGGDLHTLLRKNGSLDHESTRFVIGSVAAAIWSIHERGFVYADCKPENILITETGHIKVTDFGACRPLTEEAKSLVKSSGKNILQQLRDGDWRNNQTASIKLSGGGESYDESMPEEVDEDLRIEGTTAYLPPEVVIGGFPTAAADVWAIGCVLFQCISGRPPVLEDTDDLTAHKIVTFFTGQGASSSDTEDFFGQCDASAFRDDTKSLIKRILNRDVSSRPDILQVSTDAFFAGMDIFSLHKNPAHPLDVGSIAPVSDAKWSRRQFSSIWAPQPHAYVIGSPSHSTASTVSNSSSAPICEGDEADAVFHPTQKAPMLTKIRE